MPSGVVDLKGLPPSSFFSEEVCFPNELVFCKSATMTDSFGSKIDRILRKAGSSSVAQSPLEMQMPLDSQMANGFDLLDCYLTGDQKVNFSFERHIIGGQRAINHSSPRPTDYDANSRSNMESPSLFSGDNKINVIGAQYENGLFSSSLSELFSKNCTVLFFPVRYFKHKLFSYLCPGMSLYRRFVFFRTANCVNIWNWLCFLYEFKTCCLANVFGFFCFHIVFTGAVRFSSNNALYGHSVGAVASHHEEEPFESLEELEAQTIRDLLPNDDELLSGVVDGLNYTAQPNSGDDMEDLDLFNSIGGMDLGEDGSSSQLRVPDLLGGISNGLGGSGGSIAGEHPFGEHPSRTLFVRNINSNVEDSELRALFEQYGDIRTLYTACKHRGFVMISYYDIRAAQNAIKALQNKPLRRRKLDIHYSIPKDNPSEKDINQGTLVVFNLDSSVTHDELYQIFGVYGEIKEIRETPHRSRHKFVEFYDLRASEYALHALNSSDIAGKRIKLEPSRSGGARRVMLPFASELEQDEFSLYLQKSSLPNNLTGFSGTVSNGGSTSCGTDEAFLNMHSAAGATVSPLLNNALHQGISSSVPNSLPSLVRVETVGNTVAESSQSLGQLNFEIQGTSIFFGNGAPCSSSGNISANTNAMVSDKIESRQLCRVDSSGHSFELNEGVFGHSGNGSCPPGQQYLWSNSHHPQPQNMMWPNSPSLVNGFGSTKPPRLHAVPWAPSHILNTILPINGHHVGSAPSVNPSLWDRRHVYAGESPDASVFHPGSLGNTRISGNSPQLMEFVPPNIFPQRSGNCMDLPISSQNVGLHSHHQRCIMFPSRGQIIPMMSSFDSPNERSRSRRNEGSSDQTDNKKQFELDIDRIIRGEDKRTTLMIKNIPNKYTSKMLLAAIDERHRGSYDFVYLPIDFKNKCNVGYAFINMTDPSLIIPFYQSFNGKKWEKFNSEKVASLAYARIQGKASLIGHFQNSSLMNEDKRCRPILFHTDGPNAGDQVPFPMVVNVLPKPNKTWSSTSDE